ncbi:MAG: insulinase family protein [Candidatus Pacebacteria bacterium]|nr:insulinase family protein [Candidatus Paceibacterota bacterium]
MYKLYRFRNGLKLLSVPYKATQAICVLVLVKVGSKYEKKEINGISHFLEHMLFKGTKKRPSQKEVAEVLDKIGGNYNGFTSEEYTGYYAKVSREHLETAIDWVADIFLNSLIPEKEVDKERNVILEELNMYKDNPMAEVHRLWKKLLYGDQPAGWDIIGTKESLRKIKREGLLNFMRKNYLAKNTLICLAGNFQEGKIKELITKYFSKIQNGKPPKKAKVIEKQKSPQLLLQKRDTQQTHLCIGVRSFSLLDKRKYPLSLLASILGGMMSSRLFLEIREKRGLGYYLSTNYEADPDTGYLSTLLGVDNQRVEEATRIVLKEYKKVREKGVSKEELEKAKEYQKGRMALSLESSDAQAFFYGVQYVLQNKINTIKEIYKKIDKVEKSDILKVAREIFVPEKLNLVILGPHKNKNKFLKILKNF